MKIKFSRSKIFDDKDHDAKELFEQAAKLADDGHLGGSIAIFYVTDEDDGIKEEVHLTGLGRRDLLRASFSLCRVAAALAIRTAPKISGLENQD